MKTKNPSFIISTLFATIGIITGLSVFIYQKHFNADTMLLSDENILLIFSGNYFQMAGMGSAKLTLNPDLTFGYFIHADIDTMYGMILHGTTIITNGQIQLVASNIDGEIFVPKYLIPVRWGKHKYLVEPDHISYFCEDIITGNTPFYLGHSNYLQRPWGVPPPTKSAPILPNRKLVCP